MESKRPLVSVCIPVFQCERYIGQAIESVLRQSMTDFELIVADNASTDNTATIIRSYNDPRIHFIQNSTNRGSLYNFELVMQRSSGKYIKILGADDVLYPRCLAKQVGDMEADGKLAMSACRRDIIDACGRIVIRQHGWWGRCGRYDGRDAIRRIVRAGRNLIGEPVAVLFRADLSRRLGGFDPVMSDLDYWCRLLQAGDLFVIGESLAAFRISRGSQSVHENWGHPRNQRRYFRQLRSTNAAPITRLDIAIGAARSFRDTILRHLIYQYLRVRRGL